MATCPYPTIQTHKRSKLAMSFSSLVLFFSFTGIFLHIVQAQTNLPPLVNGLSWTFFDSTCPRLEAVVRAQLRREFASDIGQAAGLLRLHFHDCFVQGCDGSVLLEGSASGPGEQEAPPNLTLRERAFEIINDLRRRVERRCGAIVSCSDITALAARDAVFLSGGPDYRVPLGRRDGVTFATRNETLANLPAPSSNTTTILTSLAGKGLDPTDVVALSGGHTIGISHCTSFSERLYPTQDPTLERVYAGTLRTVCPAVDTDNTTNLDIRSPNVFDNRYFVGLMNRQGLFTSDQDLYTDRRTRSIVTSFAVNQTLFFERFVIAMTKMGQLNVLTGTQGQIRANCSVINPSGLDIMSVVNKGDEGLSGY